jgi:Sulfocyanin (SoxE) domain
MPRTLRNSSSALLLAAVTAAVVGCNGDRDRLRTESAAASSAPGPAASDSAQVSPDTSATAESTSSRAEPESLPGKASADTTHKTLPKPSIDPGRKNPKGLHATLPKPAAAASQPAPADTPTTGSKAAPPAGQSQGLKYDAGSNTVTFDLIGGPNGFMFNGFGSGGATLTLPANAKVVMNFVNKDGTPHSAEVISGEGPIPNASVDAAIPRAYTNQLTQGLPQEGTDVMRFTAPASGTFRIICGVPGHALSGMWIWMKIDPAAKQPTFGATKS